MSDFSIPYHRISEIPAPATYEVLSGNWWLHGAIEGGEARRWTERHIITLNEATGHFTCEGGYGTFSYCWTARGGESLHAFMYHLGFDYFMEKASKQPYRVADHPATVRSLKAEICRDRRDGSITKGAARELWWDLDVADEGDTAAMIRRLYDDSEWSARLDYSDPSVMIDHPGIRRFWDEVWLPFAFGILKPHWDAHRAALAEKVAA